MYILLKTLINRFDFSEVCYMFHKNVIINIKKSFSKLMCLDILNNHQNTDFGLSYGWFIFWL